MKTNIDTTNWNTFAVKVKSFSRKIQWKNVTCHLVQMLYYIIIIIVDITELFLIFLLQIQNIQF